MKESVKQKFVKALAFAIVSIVSAALVAWLKNPENRVFLQKKARQAKEKASKQAKTLKKKISKQTKALKAKANEITLN